MLCLFAGLPTFGKKQNQWLQLNYICLHCISTYLKTEHSLWCVVVKLFKGTFNRARLINKSKVISWDRTITQHSIHFKALYLVRSLGDWLHCWNNLSHFCWHLLIMDETVLTRGGEAVSGFMFGSVPWSRVTLDLWFIPVNLGFIWWT